ncbi:hypothetical protein [Melittangium boletus]|uniref:hypothetical protein n=1 Tax=Melittangium boletus TaxID=83453 RepID=UPI003DA2869F
MPPGDAVLSYLEPREGKCLWIREDAAAHQRATVASLEGDCKGARLFWSKDLGKALVWFDPEHVASGGVSGPDVPARSHTPEEPTPGATSRLYEVTVASGKVRPIASPTVDGQLSGFGYKGADLVALSVRSVDAQEIVQDAVTVDGKPIPLDKEVEGAPALAFAYRLEGDGTWKRVEVKATGEGSDYAPGATVLEHAKGLGLTTDDLLDSRHSTDGTEPSAELLARLQPLRPASVLQGKAEDGDGEWSHVTTPAGAYDVWRTNIEFSFPTGHIVLEQGGELKPVKDLGFTESDFVAVIARGPFLLVSADSVGIRPRLYDLRTGARVFHSDAARLATFWPTASP